MAVRREKIKVGILGATGIVGQKLVLLLENHPWFELNDLFASKNSSGKRYGASINWIEHKKIPKNIEKTAIKSCGEFSNSKILFSGLDALVAEKIEQEYASRGHVVVSNAKSHRFKECVPLVIPEVNSEHFMLILKQKERGDSSGFIVTNPNCVVVAAAIALFPIYKNFGLNQVFITTLQAVSGAGYPGISSLDILGNVIPHIEGEEEKIERELLKIFGTFAQDKINFANFKVSAMCHRVPVVEGHMLAVAFSTFKKPNREDIMETFSDYPRLDLPSSPKIVCNYFNNPQRPQPLFDADCGAGMTVSIGNLRPSQVCDWKMNVLGHNTIRGAAGTAILNAEYLLARGWIKR